MPLFPIKCNYGAIELHLAFPEPCHKLQVPVLLLPSQSSLPWIVSQQCLFNQQGAHWFSVSEFVLMKPMAGDSLPSTLHSYNSAVSSGSGKPGSWRTGRWGVPKDTPFSHACDITGLATSLGKAACSFHPPQCTQLLRVFVRFTVLSSKLRVICHFSHYPKHCLDSIRQGLTWCFLFPQYLALVPRVSYL